MCSPWDMPLGHLCPRENMCVFTQGWRLCVWCKGDKNEESLLQELTFSGGSAKEIDHSCGVCDTCCTVDAPVKTVRGSPAVFLAWNHVQTEDWGARTEACSPYFASLSWVLWGDPSCPTHPSPPPHLLPHTRYLPLLTVSHFQLWKHYRASPDFGKSDSWSRDPSDGGGGLQTLRISFCFAPLTK